MGLNEGWIYYTTTPTYFLGLPGYKQEAIVNLNVKNTYQPPLSVTQLQCMTPSYFVLDTGIPPSTPGYETLTCQFPSSCSPQQTSLLRSSNLFGEKTLSKADKEVPGCPPPTVPERTQQVRNLEQHHLVSVLPANQYPQLGNVSTRLLSRWIENTVLLARRGCQAFDRQFVLADPAGLGHSGHNRSLVGCSPVEPVTVSVQAAVSQGFNFSRFHPPPPAELVLEEARISLTILRIPRLSSQPYRLRLCIDSAYWGLNATIKPVWIDNPPPSREA